MITKFYCAKCKKLQLKEAIEENNGCCPDCGDDMSKTYDGKKGTISVAERATSVTISKGKETVK